MNKKNNTETNEKKAHLGFYLVLAMCALMIGVSCWFAYTQTSDHLTIELDSALESAHDLTAGITQTEPTESPATTVQAAAYVPPIVTEAAAAPATQAPATEQTHTETVTESVSASVPVMPLSGEIINAFSGGELVKSETTGVWQTHNGIDIACNDGDEVCAMLDGIVTAIENDPLWGVCVTIDHQNGMFSRYCGMNADLKISEGDTVTAGAPIGTVGKTADIESALPVHLHFEVLQGESYLDPVSCFPKE